MYQHVTCITESWASSFRSKVVTVLAWTEQVKCRGLREQPNYIRVVTKSCNMKLVIWINVNHNSSTALEWSVINNWGGGA